VTETMQPAAPQRTWLSTTVRYGKMAYTATFKTDRADLRKLDKAIVRTDRGREIGTILTVPTTIPEGRPSDSLWDVVRKASADTKASTWNFNPHKRELQLQSAVVPPSRLADELKRTPGCGAAAKLD